MAIYPQFAFRHYHPQAPEKPTVKTHNSLFATTIPRPPKSLRSKTLTQTPVEKQPKAQSSPSKNTSHAKHGNTGIPTLTRTRHTRRTLRHPPPQESFGPSVTANCEAALSPYQPQAPKRPIRLKTMTQTPVEKQPKAQSSPSKNTTHAKTGKNRQSSP